MLNSPMQIDKKEFQELLKEIQMYNKLDLVAQTIQTKYARESAGEDDEARRKDATKSNELLEKILVAISGTKSKSDASISKQGDKDKSSSIKDDLKQFKQELKSGVAFGKRVAGSAVEAIKSPVQTLKKGAIGAASINEQIYQQAGDILGAPADMGALNLATIAQPSAKQKIEKQSKTDNPNIIDEPNEVIAEESEKQTVVFQELLNVTKESLSELKGIRNSLEGKPASGSAQPASKTAPVLTPPEGGEGGGSGILDMFGRPMAASGGAGKVAGAAAGAGKVGLGSKIMGGLGTAAKFIGGAALAKPALIAGGIGLAAYGAYKGYKALTGGDEEDQQALVDQENQTNATYMVNGVPVSKEEYEAHNAKIKERSRQLAEGGAAALEIPSIEGRQAGGPVTEGKPYVVGERGPEVIVPSQNATVVPRNKKAAKSVPQIVETKDLGGGQIQRVYEDGSYTISGAEGTRKYGADDRFLSKTSPTVGGFTRSEDMISGEVEDRYSSGPLYAKQRRDREGKVLSESMSYDMGLAKVTASREAGGEMRTSTELRGGSEENAMLRDQISAGSGGQPVIMNNVSNNAQTTYVPMKGEPRATHRGSALDQYNQRNAVY